MKCYATYNIFGYKMQDPCDTHESEIHGFHTNTDIDAIDDCSSSDDLRRECCHHQPVYNLFEVLVNEVLDGKEKCDKV